MIEIIKEEEGRERRHYGGEKRKTHYVVRKEGVAALSPTNSLILDKRVCLFSPFF
jgi:hypothetical protein